MSRKCEAVFECYNDGAGSHPDFSHKTVKLTATCDDERWKDFCCATPSGELSMSIDKDASGADFFEAGATYRLTFEKIED